MSGRFSWSIQLFDYLAVFGRLSEDESRAFFREIEYVFDQDIIEVETETKEFGDHLLDHL